MSDIIARGMAAKNKEDIEALVIGEFGTGFVTDAMLSDTGIKAQVKEASTSDTTIEGGIDSLLSTAVNSPLNVTVKGRTVTNLMGTDGNCEDTSKFTATNCTLALDTTNKVFGSNAIKLTLSAGQTQGSMNYDIFSKLDKTKYYLVSAYLMKGTCTNLKLRLETDDADVESSAVTATAMTRTGIVIQPSDIDTATSVVIQVQINGTETQTGYVDGIMVNEITGAEYALGVSALLSRYAWHSGTKSTPGGVVKLVGKNKANPNGYNFSINPLTGMRVENTHETDYTISKAFIPAGEKAVNSVSGIKFPTNIYLYNESGNYLGNNSTDNTFAAEISNQSYNRICYILVPKYKDYGNNIWIADDLGLPSLMVYIPKFKISDIITGGSDNTHPAFIVNGTEVTGIYISKYQNVVYNNRAYSLPCKDPKTYVNFDTARQACEAKGPGWHLMTNAEWAAIVLWCRKNNLMPKGNNNYGKDVSESTYVAIPTYIDMQGKTCRVATGSGPVTWSHNGEVTGIWDLNGNVYEWTGGYRTVDGEIQILPNNDAADADNSQGDQSSKWKAIMPDGTLVAPGTAGTLKWDYTADPGTDNVGKPFRLNTVLAFPASNDLPYGARQFNTLTAANGVTVPEILKALALFPADNGGHGGDYFYMRNRGERLAYHGGAWSGASDAGVFCADGVRPRSFTSASVGFRSAYIPGI